MIIRRCPDCNAQILIDEATDEVTFTGNPRICLCHLSDEDAKNLGIDGIHPIRLAGFTHYFID